jgi:hypothetical protein
MNERYYQNCLKKCISPFILKLCWRTPLLAAGCATALVVMAIKNRVFSFADMLLFLPCFPDFFRD